jgi:hypothetical protein
MFLQLCCSCSFYIILFAKGIHFHGNIISVRWAILGHKTNIARPHFTEESFYNRELINYVVNNTRGRYKRSTVNQNIIVYANSRQIAIGDLPVLSVIYILFRQKSDVNNRK